MDTGDSSATLTLTRCALQRLASLLSLTMVTLFMSGCQCMEPDPIKVGGSSTLLPMSQAAAKEMKARRPDIQVELESGGTSKGLQDFCQGRLDMAGASRPIRIGEICPGYVETGFAEHYFKSAEKARETYSRFKVLEPIDVAEAVVYMLACPEHVQVHDVLMRPTDQPT